MAAEVVESVSAAAETANEFYENPAIITSKVNDAMADPSSIPERVQMFRESRPIGFWSVIAFLALILYYAMPYLVSFLRICYRIATLDDDIGDTVTLEIGVGNVKTGISVQVKSDVQMPPALTEVRGGYGGANNISAE